MNQSESVDLLLKLTGRINSALKTNDLLTEIMEAAKTMLNSEASSLILHDAETKDLIIQFPTGSASSKISGMRIPETEGIAGWVWKNQKALIINDAKSDLRFRGDLIDKEFYTQNLICVPLNAGNHQNIGVLQVINKKDAAKFTNEDQHLLEALANQAAISIERQRISDAMIQQERKLIEAQQKREKEAAVAFSKGVEEERTRIARELHDNILGLISITMRKIQNTNSTETTSAKDSTLDELAEISSEIRSIMDDLKPMSLKHFGLAQAIEMVVMRQIEAERNPIRFDSNLNLSSWKGNEFQEITIYRIIQESVHNAIKHGKPTKISLEGNADESSLKITLKDNGQGFNWEEVEQKRRANLLKGGNGLLNIAHRASTISASINWESEAGKGTVFSLSVENTSIN